MAYTKPTISGYNTSPPADNGDATEDNKVKWSTIKGKITDPVKVLAEALGTASETAWNDLASTATDDGTKAKNLVSIQPLSGRTETGVENYAYAHDSILRFIPWSLHESIRGGTNTTALDTYIANALNSNSGFVRFTPGEFLINQPIDTDFTGDEIRIIGAAPAANQHVRLVQQYSDTFAIETVALASMIKTQTVFKCDGCNLIGETDTISVYNANQNLKHLENVVAYGVNGAEIGVHVAPQALTIKRCFFARFGLFGLLTREGITSSFKELGFDTNGFDMAHTGSITAYPATYGSGCNIKINSSVAPQDYHTVDAAHRPSTFYFKDIWIQANNSYVNNSGTVYSGLRAIQAYGLLSGSFEGVGAYQGSYFNICRANLFGNHLENYATHGVINTDHRPKAIYASDSLLVRSANYATNFSQVWAATQAYPLAAQCFPTTYNGYWYEVTTAGTSSGSEPTFPTTVGDTVVDGSVTWTNMGSADTGADAIDSVASGNVSHGVFNLDGPMVDGRIESATIINDKMVRASELQKSITATATGGGTTTVTFAEVVEKDPLDHSHFGFHGTVSVSVTQSSNYANTAHAVFHVSAHWNGASIVEFATRLNENSTAAGAYDIEITDLTFDANGGLIVEVTWGTSWNLDVFSVNASCLGGSQLSSH